MAMFPHHKRRRIGGPPSPTSDGDADIDDAAADAAVVGLTEQMAGVRMTERTTEYPTVHPPPAVVSGVRDAPSGATATIGIPDAPSAAPEYRAAERDAAMGNAGHVAAPDDAAVFPDADANDASVIIDSATADTVGAITVPGVPIALNVLASSIGGAIAALTTGGAAGNAAAVADTTNMPIAGEAEDMD